MKKLRFILLSLALIAFIPALGHLLWIFQKEKPLNLLIVNKSVPKQTHNEVKSLNWVLNYGKILNEYNQPYDFTKDYFGFHPNAVTHDRSFKTFSLDDFDDYKRKYDGLIYLDNAGVDLEEDIYENISHFGGLNQTEYLFLYEMLNSGKLVIAEYNFYAYPTEDLVCYNAEQLLDIYSLKWRGKYFNNLDAKKIINHIDQKWISVYEKEYQKEWNFKGEGIVLLNDKSKRIIVLPAREFMTEKYPEIVTGKPMADQYNLPGKTAFDGWFELVHQGGNEIVSYINLNLNDNGRQVLKSNGLDDNFPVCIKLKDKPGYFFAADFSKQKVFLGWSRIKIISDLCRFVCRNQTKKTGKFFQTYYVPLMSEILESYYDELDRDKES